MAEYGSDMIWDFLKFFAYSVMCLSLVFIQSLHLQYTEYHCASVYLGIPFLFLSLSSYVTVVPFNVNQIYIHQHISGKELKFSKLNPR